MAPRQEYIFFYFHAYTIDDSTIYAGETFLQHLPRDIRKHACTELRGSLLWWLRSLLLCI